MLIVGSGLLLVGILLAIVLSTRTNGASSARVPSVIVTTTPSTAGGQATTQLLQPTIIDNNGGEGAPLWVSIAIAGRGLLRASERWLPGPPRVNALPRLRRHTTTSHPQLRK